MDYAKVRLLEKYMEVLQAGNDAVDQGSNHPADPPPLDVAAWKVSWRNKVVAGDSDKAAFFGTITTAPTVTSAQLQALGMTVAVANAAIAERDRIRAAALALVS